MSKSSGSIVGAEGIPKAKFILNTTSGISSYTFTVCLKQGGKRIGYRTLLSNDDSEKSRM